MPAELDGVVAAPTWLAPGRSVAARGAVALLGSSAGRVPAEPEGLIGALLAALLVAAGRAAVALAALVLLGVARVSALLEAR